MKKYLTYFNICLKWAFAYKADIYLNIAINLVFFYIFFSVWRTIYTTTGTNEIDGYSLAQTITYYFIASLIFRFDLAGTVYLNRDIWEGRLTNELVRPWNVLAVEVIGTISDIIIGVLLYLPVLALIFLTVSQYITFPGWPMFSAFVVTLILGVVMSLAFNLFLHSFAFYLGDISSSIDLIEYLISIIAGGAFPLVFLPGIWQNIALALPFKYLFFTPANIYLGKMTWPEIYLAWLSIVAWTILSYLLCLVVFKRGLRLYTGVGR